MVIAATQEFYAAVAQVIPILLLVMVVGDYRLKVRSPHARPLGSTLSATLLIILFVALGELAALKVLARGHDSAVLQLMTAIGLGLGVGYVVMKFMVATIEDFGGGYEDRFNRQLRLVAGVGFVVSVGFAFGVLTSA